MTNIDINTLQPSQIKIVKEQMLEEMLAHTHKITLLFLDKSPLKNPT